MAVELGSQPERIRFSPISWPAIFASLAVGISVMLLMTLAGVAIGISSADMADSARAITIAAAAWQAASMLVSAIVGGYVAARLSGFRRTGDGVLHGAVAWGATTVLYAVLATTALGALTSGMFGLLTANASERASATTGGTFTGDRDEAQRILERIGLTTDQARTVIDELAGGASGTQTGASAPRSEEAAGAIGTATAWLAATVLLSLVLSAAGGAIGARGVRRINRRALERDSTTTVSEAPAAILSRQV
jgi:hypothetical protein